MKGIDMANIVAITLGLMFGAIVLHMIAQKLRGNSLVIIIMRFKFVLGIWVGAVAAILKLSDTAKLHYELMLFCLGVAIIICIYAIVWGVFKTLGRIG